MYKLWGRDNVDPINIEDFVTKLQARKLRRAEENLEAAKKNFATSDELEFLKCKAESFKRQQTNPNTSVHAKYDVSEPLAEFHSEELIKNSIAYNPYVTFGASDSQRKQARSDEKNGVQKIINERAPQHEAVLNQIKLRS